MPSSSVAIVATIIAAAITAVDAAACTASTVTCCFAANEASITQITLDDVDYRFTPTTSKVLTFDEPYMANTVFSVHGHGLGALAVQCTSTRADSAWNSIAGWTHSNGASAAGDLDALAIHTELCGQMSYDIQPLDSKWDVHTTVQSNKPACNEHEASIARSLQTTEATVYPTKRPTKTPTSKPTKQPSTRKPSKLPTAKPSKTPTAYPTAKPSKSPTAYPTAQPSESEPIVGDAADTHAPTMATVTTAPKASVKPFTIEVRFDGTTTPAIQAAFKTAAQRWSAILGQALPNAVNVNAGKYCGVTFDNAFSIDNILIVASIVPIDGLYNILGSAGPCLIDNLRRPRFGTMRFDVADVNWMVSQGTLGNVILHEMGHVLGLGTMWENGLLGKTVLPGTGGYAYSGQYGNMGNVEVGRSGAAVVEDTGGPGTARGHWKEAVYDNELMTGYVESGNVRMPISRLTVQALRDLGFPNVDVSKADVYTVPLFATGRRLRTNVKNKIPLLGCGGHKPNEIQMVETVAKPGREREHEEEFVQVTAMRAARKTLHEEHSH